MPTKTVSPVLAASGRSPCSKTVAKQCIDALGSIQPTMLLVFCGGYLDGREVLKTLRQRYGAIPIVGGAAVGAITHDSASYAGSELAVLAFTDPRITPKVFSIPDLRIGEAQAGAELAAMMCGHIDDNTAICLFFGNVARVGTRSRAMQLHHVTPIIDSFYSVCHPLRPPVLGAGCLTNLKLHGGWVYDGNQVRHQGLVALVWPPDVTVQTILLHSCIPASDFFQITRMEGAVVYELNGEPALSVLERQLPLPLSGPAEDPQEAQPLTILGTLGQKLGDPFAPPEDAIYINQIILSTNRKEGSVTLFEPAFKVGSYVQLMARNRTFMLDSVREGARIANQLIKGSDTIAALYINGAGRTAAVRGGSIEEAQVLAQSLPSTLPLFGFYSGIQIAPAADALPKACDWTGLLVLLCRRP